MAKTRQLTAKQIAADQKATRKKYGTGGSTGTIGKDGRFTLDPPGKSILDVQPTAPAGAEG